MSAEDEDALFAEARRRLREEGMPEGGTVYGVSDAPSQIERQHRAVICAAVAARALNEREGTSLAEARLGLLDWVEATGAASALEPREALILAAEPGELREPDLTDAAWRTEGAAVIAWALGLVELPEPGDMADPASVFAALGLADAMRTEAAFSGAAPRTGAAIGEVHRRLAFLHGELHREIEDGEIEDGGVRDRVLLIRSITVERLRAAAWLVDGGSFEDADVSPGYGSGQDRA